MPRQKQHFSPNSLLGLDTGVRRGEILGLRWKDIDLLEKNLMVQNQLQYMKKSKTHELVEVKSSYSIRSIPLTKRVTSMLKDIYKSQLKSQMFFGAGYKKKNFVFVDELGENVKPDWVTRNFSKVLAELGITDGRTFHNLRHTYASTMIRAGVNATTLAGLLGHHSSDFTHRAYLHLFQDSKKEAVQKYEKLLAERSYLRTEQQM